MSRSKDARAPEHAKQLRRALAQADISREEVAMALGVAKRTIMNWVSPTDPTMPSDRMLEQLAILLPGYAEEGDPVQVALRRSGLAPWRQVQLYADFQRHLHEQAREDAATGS